MTEESAIRANKIIENKKAIISCVDALKDEDNQFKIYFKRKWWHVDYSYFPTTPCFSEGFRDYMLNKFENQLKDLEIELSNLDCN